MRTAPSTLWRRRRLCGLLVSFVVGLHSVALGGSYLDRAALLVHGSKLDTEYLRSRLNDRELARVVHEIARGRLQAAKTMLVPEEVVQAHPHLLMLLENHERAAEAAVERQPARFLVFHRKAGDEELIFKGVLKQLGWTLPRVRSPADG